MKMDTVLFGAGIGAILLSILWSLAFVFCFISLRTKFNIGPIAMSIAIFVTLILLSVPRKSDMIQSITRQKILDPLFVWRTSVLLFLGLSAMASFAFVLLTSIVETKQARPIKTWYLKTMGPVKVTNSLNKSLRLTGIGLAVQAFYIYFTMDSALGGEYLQLASAGLPVINQGSVWDMNGIPMVYGYNRGGVNTGGQRVGTLGVIGGQNNDGNGFRDQNGYYLGNAGLKNGYDVGKTYGAGRDYGITGVQGNTYDDVNGRNKGHQVAGFNTNYQKNESGNKATYYDDGLGHGGVVQYGLRDQRSRDGAGNAYGGGVHDSSLKANAQGNQGQFGAAGGYRGTDNRGGTAGNVDMYRGGLVQGASGGVLGPIVHQPIYVQQPFPVVQRSLPVAQAAPIPFRSSPYVLSTPNQFYVDRAGIQNVLMAAG